MNLKKVTREVAIIAADLEDLREGYAMEIQWAEVQDEVDEAIRLLYSVYDNLRF